MRAIRLVLLLPFFVACGGATASGAGSRSTSADPMSAPAPSQSDLRTWLREGPHTFGVSSVGSVRGSSDATDFDMRATVKWRVTGSNDRLVLDQSSFSGFEGRIAPATFGRTYILPFVDPVFDRSMRPVAVDGAADSAALAREAIARAPGVPFGNAPTFDAALTDAGMLRYADDFFAPLYAYASRPTDGTWRVLGEARTTSTPFGPLDVVTRFRLEAEERATCPDASDTCIVVRIVGEPDEAELGEAASTSLPGLPPGLHIDTMTIRDETTLVVRRSPARIERLSNYRIVRATAHTDGDRRSRELVATESRLAFDLLSEAD